MTGNKQHEQLDPAHAVAIVDLVDVAEAATVSRVLIRRAGGNMTLFAFAGGQELSEHTAPFDALVQVLEGELVLVIGGDSVRARPGEIVLMPADIPHGLRAVEDTKMLLTMLRDKGKE